jgi:hypothetical protein
MPSSGSSFHTLAILDFHLVLPATREYTPACLPHHLFAFALARHWRHTPVYDALLEQDGIYLHNEPSLLEPNATSEDRQETT